MYRMLPLLALSGCMTYRYYPLPVAVKEARSTFAPLAAAAKQLGYKTSYDKESVWVEPNDYTQISYTVRDPTEYALWVGVHRRRAPNGIPAARINGKKIADQIWIVATGLRGE